jgi:hypothetical protein
VAPFYFLLPSYSGLFIVQIPSAQGFIFCNNNIVDTMSAALISEAAYRKLSGVEPSISALSVYLRRENGGQVIRETKSFYSRACGRHIYEMSDGHAYALNDEHLWMVIPEACECA